MADEPLSARELLAKLDDYHKEIVALAKETTTATKTLDDAVKIVNSQKDTIWAKIKVLMPVIIIVAIIIAILVMRPAGVCKLSIVADKGVEATRCE